MTSPVDDASTPAQPVKEERAKSLVEFTYNALDDSEELVTIVRSIGGTGCSVNALAAKLNQSPSGGAFRMKLYSARSFGLADLMRGDIELTDLGLRVIDPNHAKAARVEAFLRVPLYRLTYEQLQGQPMPPAIAVERMMVQAGVPPKQKERARQVFMRSAKAAGFFDIHPDRLVKPETRDAVASAPAAAVHAAPEAPRPEVERRSPARFAGGGGWDGGDGIHPAILGLLRGLPPEGTEMTAKRRDQLIAAFSSAIAYIYPEPENSQ